MKLECIPIYGINTLENASYLVEWKKKLRLKDKRYEALLEKQKSKKKGAQ